MAKAKRRRWKLPIVAMLLFCILAIAVSPGRPPEKDAAAMEDRIVKIKEQMQPLESVRSGDYPDCVKMYFDYYGLDMTDRIEGVEHLFGTFKSSKWTLAANIYRPGEYKATVVLLHGYLNHIGQFKHLIRHLLEHGYAVAVYDMPGHGLSSGERAVIGNFSEYTQTLVDYTKIVGKLTKGPYHLIGFSTGGTVAIDYVLVRKGDFFDRVVLAAPLVRSVAWKSSEAAYKLYNNFADSIPRAKRKNSSDKEFLKFNKYKDVLHCQKVSLKWVKALYDWNDKVEAIEPDDRSIAVIQGTKDTTVSYRYNLKFIKSKFPNAAVTMIADGRHELFNESKELRRIVLDGIVGHLE
ncbi:MAG: alpha/beta hydrolase [Planctomycetes bacterium]|nr:alpha/beta hydrolase [Planctomycetota bacterium]